MILPLERNIFNITQNINRTIVNGFRTSSLCQLKQDWRMKKRLTTNPNKFGPLTNLPDYTFCSGKPTPFGVRQLIRIKEQREILQKVKRLVFEVDYAVERYTRMQQEKQKERDEFIDAKFKPKGDYLLTESKTKQLKE